MREPVPKPDPFAAVLRSVGRATPDEWRRALARKRLTPEWHRPSLGKLSEQESKALATSKAGLFIPRTGKPVLDVKAAKNPAPCTSFGFVDAFASVDTNAEFLDGFLVLKTNADGLAHVRPDSLRLFRWDASVRRFAIVPHSSPGPGGRYVAGRISRSGVYAAIGLHIRPEVVETVRIMCGLASRARQLPSPERAQLKTRICELILCARDVGASLPERVVEARGPCETCLGLPDDGWMTLPECEILGEPIPCRDGDWQNLGPLEIMGFENRLFNRGIGCGKQIAIDPTDHRRVYATGEHGGLWVLHRADQWPDNRWTPLTDDLEGLQMRALTIAPSDADRLYVGNGLGFVYVSRNRGAAWTRTSDTNFGFIRRILVHRSNPDTIFVAANSGLYNSPDVGVTWATLLDAAAFPTPDVLDAAIDPDDSSILYIGVRRQGVFKSYDTGQNWETVLPFSVAVRQDRHMIRLSLGMRHLDGSPQTDLDRSLAIKFGQEVFVSSDGGRTQPVSVGSRGGSGGNRRRSDQGQPGGEWCNVLAVDPNNPALILAGQQDLFKTTDGGTTWRRITGDDVASDGLGNPRRLIHEDFQDISFDPHVPGLAYLVCDGGAYVYLDGRVDDPVNGDIDTERFEERNDGFAVSQFFRVGVRGDVAIGNLDHNGLKATTSLGSGLWTHVPVGNNALETHYVYPDPKRDGRFYTVDLATAGAGQLKRLRFPMLDDGKDLLAFAPFVPYFSVNDAVALVSQYASLPVGPVAVDVRDASNAMLACAHATTAVPAQGFRLMITTEADKEPDVDAAGNPIGLPAWEVAFDNGNVDPMVSVIFAPSSPGSVYAISGSGVVIFKADVTAGAVNADWEVRGPWAETDVRQIVVNAEFAQRIYAVSGTTFGRSRDGGRNWDTAGVSSPVGRELNSIAVHPRDPHTLFVGADTGVFISYDEGERWSPYDKGLPNAEVTQVIVDGPYLYAVTHGRGLWRRRYC